MTRKIALLLPLAILPGGLAALFLMLVGYSLSRTTRGRRWLTRITPRLPSRLVEHMRAFTTLPTAAGPTVVRTAL